MGDVANNRGANIQRTGGPGSYNYSVAPDWANRPVNHVSLWDAMRFANWLHNGQPNTGVQDDTSTEDGAYDLDGYMGFDGTWIVRKSGARWFIPTEDEWYKAAYHKNDGATGNYWEYPTKSDIAPNNTLPDPGNHANFDGTGNGLYTIGPPFYRTEVGAFENTAGPYGTFDQGGNVSEWNETLVHDFGTTDHRGVRGGSFYGPSFALRASWRHSGTPTSDTSNWGFRIATIIPEPSTIVLLGFGVLLLGHHWCREKCLLP
jgi:formylglycine-generating enzyme required for sulfatase activity